MAGYAKVLAKVATCAACCLVGAMATTARAAAGEGGAADGRSRADAVRAIDAVVRRYHQAGKFDGVVLVAERGDVIYSGGVGPADAAGKIPNSPDVRYPITSITKQFTALLVMQLVEQKKLALDVPIAAYLPEFGKDAATARAANRVTLRHLLVHTSGLPDSDAEPGFYQETDAKRTAPTAVVRRLLSGTPRSEPGEKFQYNNGDYFVAGLVLERVAGKPYDVLLRERILSPLGLADTGPAPRGKAPETGRVGGPVGAKGYIRKAATLEAEPPMLRGNYWAAGSLYSTVGDLLRWDRALTSNRLLSRGATAEMFASRPDRGYAALGSWAYGVRLPGGKTLDVVERRGTSGAARSLNVFTPDGSLVLIVLSNVRPGFDDEAQARADADNLFGLPAGVGMPYEILSALTTAGR